MTTSVGLSDETVGSRGLSSFKTKKSLTLCCPLNTSVCDLDALRVCRVCE